MYHNQQQPQLPELLRQVQLPGQQEPQPFDGKFPASTVRTSLDVVGSQQKPAPEGWPRFGTHLHGSPKPLSASSPPQLQLAGVMPTGPQFQPPQPPMDVQPLQELIGGNWLFVVFVPYFIATALQDTHLRIGLIVATAISCTVFLAGLLAFVLNMRKVFPHILELLMPIIYAVQLGVSYRSTSYEREIIRTYPFITHSALAGVCLASMLICYPVGYQTAQELVHKMYMTNPDVHRVGLYTTAVLTGSLVTSCLLYLAPLCKGYDDQHFNALNLIFRLIYPCIATFLSLLFVRFFPDVYLPNLAVVHGLNRKPRAWQSALEYYLSDATVRRPPAILDPSMFQSSVEAATKAREAAVMGRVASRYSHKPPMAPAFPPAFAPGYGPGGVYLSSDAHATAMAVPSTLLPHMPAAASDTMLLHGSQPVARYSIGTEDAAGRWDSVRGVAGTPPRALSAGAPHSVYTYFAAGPPAKPPLAVYALYGDFDGLPQMAQPYQQYAVKQTLVPSSAMAPQTAYYYRPQMAVRRGLEAHRRPLRTPMPMDSSLFHPTAPEQPPTYLAGVRPAGSIPAVYPMDAASDPDMHGTAYGLGAEVRQHETPGIYGMHQSTAQPGVVPGYGLEVETAKAAAAGPDYDTTWGQGPRGGLLSDQVQEDSYGLLTDVQAAARPPLSPLHRAPLQQTFAGPMSANTPQYTSQLPQLQRDAIAMPSTLERDEGFGLDAEVSLQSPPSATQPPYMGPSPGYGIQPQFGSRPRRMAAVESPPSGGEMFGLDAEVRHN
ncbi:hypothetical protein Vretimale_10702 [Volvox reticuliferus]|uniref:Uncharacterized protein n=1 Tax=Volvox reticuliferus TaxID=1737510 RepID=A0A8J4GFW5_9CHLO|nr:hypothetical protein Vretifemale_13802 [Volvox reticuliferus]GIM06395.1 hypothetical protein Vretimale_10702 [Volvox reticuliferus]